MTSKITFLLLVALLLPMQCWAAGIPNVPRSDLYYEVAPTNNGARGTAPFVAGGISVPANSPPAQSAPLDPASSRIASQLMGSNGGAGGGSQPTAQFVSASGDAEGAPSPEILRALSRLQPNNVINFNTPSGGKGVLQVYTVDTLPDGTMEQVDTEGELTPAAKRLIQLTYFVFIIIITIIVFQ